jgi:hypothetical protein
MRSAAAPIADAPGASHTPPPPPPARPAMDSTPAAATSYPTRQDRPAIGGQPVVHALPGHPEPGRDLDDLRSAQHHQNRPIALLHNGHVHQHQSRPPTTKRAQTSRDETTDDPGRAWNGAPPGTPVVT